MDVNSFVIGYNKGKASGGGMKGFHKVQFFNDDRTTLLYTVFVPTGANVIYAGDTPVSAEDATFLFTGFEPSPTNVTEDMDCYAVYSPVRSLEESSWEAIARVSADGTAQNYFAIGDTKMIHIEGKVGTVQVNGDYGVYILGFDHNEELEGKGIHFGTFKSANGVDLAFIDSKLNNSMTSGKYFNINHAGDSTHGGWAGCDMRYDILGSTDNAPTGYNTKPAVGRLGYDPSESCTTSPVADTLMAALPADLRAVMKPMTKYTDNIGNEVNTEEAVTATVDYLPLLAEFEIKGLRSKANQYEQNKQKQYDYYISGNSPKKYRFDDSTKTTTWWLRSPKVSTWQHTMYSGGDFVGEMQGCYCQGLAPIFKV